MDHNLAMGICKKYLQQVIVFVSTLALYFVTLAPSMTGGDSGEFIALAYTWGIAHPPGFPLYVLLLNLFTSIPFGGGGFQVNLFSAIVSSASIVFVYSAAKIIFGRWQLALAVGLFFGFSPVVWEYAVSAEAFAFNNFFVAGLMYLAVKFEQNYNKRFAYATALWCTLGLSNHHIFLFFSLPYFLRLCYLLFKNSEQRTLGLCCGIAVIGFVPYIYLPIAYNASPPVIWGDISSFEGFLHHFLRRDYGTLRLAGTDTLHTDGDYGIFVFYLKSLAQHVYYIGVIPLIFGIRKSWKKPWQKWAIVTVVGYIVLFSNLSNFDLRIHVHRVMQLRFLQQAELFIYLWTVLGLVALGKKFNVPKLHHVILGLSLLYVVAGFAPRWKAQEPVYPTFAKAILSELPTKSILITRSDHILNPVRAAQFGEGFRKDVYALDLFLLKYDWYNKDQKNLHPEIEFPGPRLKTPQGGYTLTEFIRKNLQAGHEVFLCDGFRNQTDEFYKVFKVRPFGLSQQVLFKYESESESRWISATDKVIKQMKNLKWDNFPVQSWEEVAEAHFFEGLHFFGTNLILGGQNNNNFMLLEKGINELEYFVEHSNFEKVIAYYNLGLAYRSMLAKDPKLIKKVKFYLEKFLERAPQGHSKRKFVNNLLASLK